MDAGKPGQLSARIDEAFRVQPVTESFYESYKDVFNTLSSELRQKGLELEDADEYAHITLNRLMFFYYLQKKGWIGGRKDFVRWFHDQYRDSSDSDCFHEKWLSALFFDGMNQPEGTSLQTGDFPDNVSQTISGFAYMNGGLFQRDDLDRGDIYLSDEALDKTIQSFLEQYNFTVTEESPYDIDVAVDPAMLGKIYESLIAEQERGEAGIFYTPRVEVDLMCRLSLYEQFCDHANDLDEDGKRRIVEFVFSEPQDWDPRDVGKTDRLEEILHSLRIVDPACGSGAFLVGMKQVITELYQKLDDGDGDVYLNYSAKEQIINENLYGVDIKDWAVRVAEFRLWLSLVEGEHELPEQRPVLPNFSFKLKVGDSLIQKLDGEFVSLDTLTRTLDGNTGDLLTELKELKREHFEGEADRTQEIEKKQVELLQKHIDGLIDNLSKDGSQQTLFGDTKDDQTDDNKKRIEDLEEVRDTVNEAGNAGFFMWDIDFSDVMVEGGFDVVIGNPPYIRRERLYPQNINPERIDEYSDEKTKQLKEDHVADLREYVQNTYGLKTGKWSDLYVYFFFRGIDILRNNGTLQYITSNSWLDIGYGGTLQEGLLTNTEIRYILGNTAAKSFEDADVNTVITTLRKSTKLTNTETAFCSFSQPYVDIELEETFEDFLAANPDSIENINLDEEPLKLATHDVFRTTTASRGALWRLGGGSTNQPDSEGEYTFSETAGVDDLQMIVESFGRKQAGQIQLVGSYDRGKWGKFIDAPKLYFDIWQDNNDKFDLMGDLSEPHLGIMSGANKFFFVPRPGTENTTYSADMDSSTGELVLEHKDTNREFRIEPEFWMRPLSEIPNRYHDQYDHIYTYNKERLVPNLILVKNREIKTSPIEPKHLNSVHVHISENRNNLSTKGRSALKYIKFGEEARWGRTNKALSERTNLSRRDPWYSQPTISDPYILLTRFINAEFQYHYNPCAHPVADNFYYLPVGDKVDPGFLAGYMNSTLGWFMIEVSGRSWTNTLRFDKTEYQQVPILSNGDESIDADVEARLNTLMGRDSANVFEELGAYNPDAIFLETISEERLELDSALFDLLDFSTEQRIELYKEMIRLVRDRLMRQPDENPSLCETIAKHNPQYDYSR